MRADDMATYLIEDCALATVDRVGTEYHRGYIVVDGARIAAVGEGRAPECPGIRRIDGLGCLATPGLVNAHHHLFQWITKDLASDAGLFQRLQVLYPLWMGLDEQITYDTAADGLARLAMSGCTTSSDHHFLMPRDGGDLLAAGIAAARRIGLRFHPCRGAMDRGHSDGGLPPDEIVENLDAILDATVAAIDQYHDPAPGAMLRIAVAPCSLFTSSSQLYARCADLARSCGVRLHTHITESSLEQRFCQVVYGCDPMEYLERLGWLGDDVWLAHGVHLSGPAIEKLAMTGTSIAHCASSDARLGVGLAPVRRFLDAKVPVGLGADGAASDEPGLMVGELRQTVRGTKLASGPGALSVREALAIGTIGGARCLGRDDEIGSLEPGKLADIVLWRLAGLGHSEIVDPVSALVLGPPTPVEALLVNGRLVVAGGELRTADPQELAVAARAARRRIGERLA